MIGGPTCVICNCFVIVGCGGCVPSICFSCFRQSRSRHCRRSSPAGSVN